LRFCSPRIGEHCQLGSSGGKTRPDYSGYQD
jgi:hypothetical protein